MQLTDDTDAASIQSIAWHLQDLFGQKMVAVMVGIREPKQVGRWARGEEAPTPEQEHTLRCVEDIAQVLLSKDGPETVRSWFMGTDPYLKDENPALAVRFQPDEVMRSARAFAAGGGMGA